jgi:hypothetical protein
MTTYEAADTAYRAAFWAFEPTRKGFLAGTVSYEDYFSGLATFNAAKDALDAAEADLPEETDEAAEVATTETQIELF